MHPRPQVRVVEAQECALARAPGEEVSFRQSARCPILRGCPRLSSCPSLGRKASPFLLLSSS